MDALSASVIVIGAGPAGLMAAERLAASGLRVTVHERMPSVARKLLLAGRGGLNLTHSEPLEPFLDRYGPAHAQVSAWLDGFAPADLIAWAEGMGQETFTGSSGRVFPKAMKASPLLRAWLRRLAALGVEIRARSRWTGWQGGALVFETPHGEVLERPDAAVLALGGASWPRLGADGAWTDLLAAEGVAIAPLRPANAGVTIVWSPVFLERFAGAPLKGVALSHAGQTVRGEALVAAYGLEGGAVYAVFAGVRDAVARHGRTVIGMDLKPDLTADRLAQRLARPRGKTSLSNHLRKTAGLDPVAIGLLREAGPMPDSPESLAAHIKELPLTVTGVQGLARAISTAGGVVAEALDDRLMLKARPGVFVAGEMLDWEAPTGGYLLQASFASGVAAARGVADWLAERARAR